MVKRSGEAQRRRFVLLACLVSALGGCAGVGVYAEANASLIQADLGDQARPDLRDPLPDATRVTTWGFALGLDFEFIGTIRGDMVTASYIGLGFMRQDLTLNESGESLALSDLELLVTSGIPAIRGELGGLGVLVLGKAALGAWWNSTDDSGRRMLGAFGGLGGSVLRGPHTGTVLAGPIKTTWTMDSGGSYDGVGGMVRVRYSYAVGGRKIRRVEGP